MLQRMNNLLTLVICFSFGCSSVLCATNIEDEYIIKLKPGTTATQFISKCLLKSKNGDLIPLNTVVKHVYNKVFDGFSAKLDKTQLTSLEANIEIERIEKNQIAKIFDASQLDSEWITQTDATWGLARISANKTLENSPYEYSYKSSAGESVTVYVIDSGVYTEHEEFGGRAVKGINFVSDETDADLNGHGTHVAGTVAGSKYGIAKKANIVAVKVLDKDGSGFWDDIIAGIDWVVQNNTSNRSVINMSLGGLGNVLVDTAIQSAVKSGITAVVAAGNSYTNSCLFSPAREPLVITVAASDIYDTSAIFTNFGSCVDLYAPGVNITSAWIGTPTNVSTISGTSMASPHVAGLAAYLISEYDLNSPAEVEHVLVSYAILDALSSVPINTVNLLAHINVTNYTSPFTTVPPIVTTEFNVTNYTTPVSTQSTIVTTEFNGCVNHKIDIISTLTLIVIIVIFYDKSIK